jgi:hypothetical protein
VKDNGGKVGLEPKKQEIKFTPDYEAGEPIFWHVFEELSNDGGNGLVYYVGEAVLMIEQMEKIGEIEQTGHYHVYRRRIAASPEQKHPGDGTG